MATPLCWSSHKPLSRDRTFGKTPRLDGLNMVDAPPLRNFIVPVVFLAFYATLIGFMPSELITGEIDIKEGYFPDEYWDMSNILNMTSVSYTHTVTYGSGYYMDEWGKTDGFGHHFRIIVYEGSDGVEITNQHYFVWIFDLPYGNHNMKWYGVADGVDYGEHFTELEFDSISETNNNFTTAQLKVTCDHVTMYSVVGYNSTEYSTMTEAFEDDGLYVDWRIGWEEIGTSFSAWDLLTGLIFFQADSLNIHPYINALIAFPIWAAIAYLGYCLVLAWLSGTIPFLG